VTHLELSFTYPAHVLSMRSNFGGANPEGFVHVRLCGYRLWIESFRRRIYFFIIVNPSRISIPGRLLGCWYMIFVGDGSGCEFCLMLLVTVFFAF
jgi:hypothetical protein